jgi:hypothetical protein
MGDQGGSSSDGKCGRVTNEVAVMEGARHCKDSV